MIDLLYFSSDSSALLDTASVASRTRCLSDGGVAICVNSLIGTRVLNGSNCFSITVSHSALGPYQYRLPYGVEALLTYNHRCFYVYVEGVTTCTGCTGGG